jgi:hypothetical protein
MSGLFEDPTLPVVLGIITAVILGFVWLQTGRRPFIYGLSAVIVLTILVIVIERVVVTDREEVDSVLRQAARAVEKNELAGVLRLIHPESPGMRAQAEAEFPKYKFESVSIKQNLKITLDQPGDANEAEATFNVMVIGSDRAGTMEHVRVPRYVIVKFRKDGDTWKAYSYEHHDPREGLLDKGSE